MLGARGEAMCKETHAYLGKQLRTTIPVVLHAFRPG